MPNQGCDDVEIRDGMGARCGAGRGFEAARPLSPRSLAEKSFRRNPRGQADAQVGRPGRAETANMQFA